MTTGIVVSILAVVVSVPSPGALLTNDACEGSTISQRRRLFRRHFYLMQNYYYYYTVRCYQDYWTVTDALITVPQFVRLALSAQSPVHF